jgi:hypothetical protein
MDSWSLLFSQFFRLFRYVRLFRTLKKTAIA